MRNRARAGILAVAALFGAPAIVAAATPGKFALEPYQLVRSLELVQDRIADGDDAALPMQRKLLEMIDVKLLATPKDDFKDDRNFQALLVYAISGGNPATIESVVSRLALEPPRAGLGQGILGYVRGRPAEAEKALQDVDPLTQPTELGAYLALIKGSVAAADNSAAALRFFDEARLLGSGSLVEEAALRRSIMIALKMKDPARFLGYSEQYVRRFQRSPYASQFADAFVAGVVDMHGAIDMRQVALTVNEMGPDRRKFIYLRLARKGAIDGLTDLTAFASRMADVRNDPGAKTNDPRVLLYSSIASVASGSVGAVAMQLRAIDRSRLTEGDQRLLDAATAIATQVTATPKADATEKAGPASDQPSIVPQKASKPANSSDAAEMQASTKIVSETRKKLAAIDELLKETD